MILIKETSVPTWIPPHLSRLNLSLVMRTSLWPGSLFSKDIFTLWSSFITLSGWKQWLQTCILGKATQCKEAFLQKVWTWPSRLWNVGQTKYETQMFKLHIIKKSSPQNFDNIFTNKYCENLLQPKHGLDNWRWICPRPSQGLEPA